MSPSRFIGAAFGACDGIMAMAMDGLTDEDLMKRLSDQANTIGWLRWHSMRVEEASISGLMHEPSCGFPRTA